MAPSLIDVARPAEGAVLSITLNQPKANVLSMAMLAEIEAALAEHKSDVSLKLVVFRGAGGNFSFGASVPEHQKEQAPSMLAAFHRTIRAIAGFPVPIASVVEGRCLGGAFELVLATHFIFASANAVFACPEIKLGVIPPVLAVLGHHKLGVPLAERMLLTGCEIDVRTAHVRGMVDEILPEEIDPQAWVLAWYAKNLAPLSAFSLRQATAVARAANGVLTSLGAPLEQAERHYVERLLPSHDGNEGIEAFLAKRRPQWSNA